MWLIFGGYGLKLESVVEFVVGCCWVLGGAMVVRLWFWVTWVLGFVGRLMLGRGYFLSLVNGGGLLGVSFVNGCGGR